jgi:hypothetical protein
MNIQIEGTTLYTPDATIEDCWEDRSSGLLSRAAGLAIMPYMNADDRAYAAWDAYIEANYEYGDPNIPDPPVKAYHYFIDGEQAIPAKEVQRDSPIIVGNEEPTGRVYLTTYAELSRMMERETL